MFYTNTITNTITITFGDQAENHVGMQKIGNLAEEGFSILDLQKAKEKFVELKYKCDLINLNTYVNDSEIVTDPASILIIRDGIKLFLEDKSANDLYKEQNSLNVDKKAFMYGRVVNKHARHNLCFGDNSQEPDYPNKKGRIVNWENVPLTKKVRTLLPTFFGEKARNLTAEGNYYYDTRKCYIGYHGDTERKVVIAVRLGASMPLYYNWFKNGIPIGKTAKFVINSGDIYVMSEKATGNDWKKKSLYTLRHAAGQDQNVKLKKTK
jgi:hypothetical protein